MSDLSRVAKVRIRELEAGIASKNRVLGKIKPGTEIPTVRLLVREIAEDQKSIRLWKKLL